MNFGQIRQANSIDMEPAGISIIQTGGIADNAGGKSKDLGITFNPSSSIQAAKEKIVTPCKWTFQLFISASTGILNF